MNQQMNKWKKGLFRAAIMMVMPFFLSGCATGLYVATQFSEPQRQIASNVWPVGNILHGDFLLWHETWNGPEDYLLPSWLDRSLNSACIILDMPISLFFDAATAPWQICRYYFPPEVIAIQNMRLENPVRYYRVELRQRKLAQGGYEISARIVDAGTSKPRICDCGVIGTASSLAEALRRYGNITSNTREIIVGKWAIPLSDIVFSSPGKGTPCE